MFLFHPHLERLTTDAYSTHAQSLKSAAKVCVCVGGVCSVGDTDADHTEVMMEAGSMM